MNMNMYIVSTLDTGLVTGPYYMITTYIDFELIRCLECNNEMAIKV